MSTRTFRFAELLEMIERLPLDERQSLIDIAGKRLAEDERTRIAISARSARREHARGKTKPVTPEQLMREIIG